MRFFFPALFVQDDALSINTSVKALHDWLAQRYFRGELQDWTAALIVILGTIAVAAITYGIARFIVLVIVGHVVKRTPTKWDDFLLQRRFFTRLTHLVPAVIVYLSAALFTPPFFEVSLEVAVQRIATAYTIFIGIFLVIALLNASEDIYQTLKMSRNNPIRGFVQGIKLLVWVIGGVFLAATLTGRDPWGIVSAIGAVTAVVMLVFKDTILGLVASIQIFVNDLVNIGDWIEMPKFGADGDVIDITLTTVKVQNWDKTITTIPSYALIADSFKNWRGMQSSGGRRIKRSLHIDMNTIRFCDEAMINRFRKYTLLSEYINERAAEIEEHNQTHDVDVQQPVNGRRMTNVGCFREYVKRYLHENPKIHKGMTFLVRQLAPSKDGLPIEIYVFSNDVAWTNYEGIQADIFDHLLAVLPEFDLTVHQNPTGRDFQQIAS